LAADPATFPRGARVFVHETMRATLFYEVLFLAILATSIAGLQMLDVLPSQADPIDPGPAPWWVMLCRWGTLAGSLVYSLRRIRDEVRSLHLARHTP